MMDFVELPDREKAQLGRLKSVQAWMCHLTELMYILQILIRARLLQGYSS